MCFRKTVLRCVMSMIALPAASVRAQEPVTAFVNVGVVPMDQERVLRDQTVIVRGGRIATLGPASQTPVPAGAVRVDGRGKFLIPGLGDMHVHTPGFFLSAKNRGETMSSEGIAEAERMLMLLAANGVTTVRIMYGWRDDGTLKLRERAAKGELLSPRIYAATMPVSPGLRLDSVAPLVQRAKASGYDLIKVYGVGGAELDSLAAAAHRIGVPIAGHAPIGQENATTTLHQVVKAGYSSLEHLSGFAAYLTGDGSDTWVENPFAQGDTAHQAARPIDESKLKSIAAAMKQAGVWNCPTELLNEGFAPASHWPELRYVSAEGRKRWQEHSDYHLAGREVAVEARRNVIRALHVAGVGLLLGTDAGVPFILPGFSAHRELGALVRAGLTPYEALATSTRNIAAYLGTSDSTGTVAVGKRADLVLVNGNPLQQIENTRKIAGVMLGGRWLTRKELDHRLAALEGTLR